MAEGGQAAVRLLFLSLIKHLLEVGLYHSETGGSVEKYSRFAWETSQFLVEV
jgi:hypothetical protein